MKTITVELVKSLDPCKERFDNFVKHYPNFNGTFNDFVELPNITYDDKIWVIVRLFDKMQNLEFGIKCAESVLPIYEKENSNPAPKKAIEAAKAYLNSPSEENRAAANAAAHAARAADAAAYAAYAAADAAYAAYAAADAARAAAYAAKDKEQQQNLNLQFAVEVWGTK